LLKILDQYILKEQIKPFLAGVAAFIVIMLSNTLFLFAEMIIKTGIPVRAVLSLLLYTLPAIIVVTLPVGYLFSTLLVLGRFSKDSEIVALQSCGVSFTRIITPILLIAALISLLGFLLNDEIVPEANFQTVKIANDMQNNLKLPPIKERQFTKIGTDNNDQRAFYVEKVNKQKGIMEDVFVFDNTKPGYPQVINANSAVRNKSRFILNNGSLRRYNNEGFVNYEAKFKSMEIEFNLNGLNYIPHKEDSIMTMNHREAAKKIVDEKAKGHDTRGIEVEYYVKFSLPLATFFVALIAAPIGIKFAKMGTYFGVSISIALVFVWYITYSIGKALGTSGILPTMLAAWIQNIAFAVIGIFLLNLVNRK
jgi:lipopolysaccharide export system permease protein